MQTRSVAVGVILVTATGRITYANTAAIEILDKSSGDLSAKNGKLKIHQDLAHCSFSRALRDCERDEVGLGPVGLGIPVGFHRANALSLHLLPLRNRGLSRTAGRDAVAAVFMTEPGRALALPLETLGGLFGLTPAEARVAIEICAGGTRADIASRLGIGGETTKSHLARLFAKTNTTSQNELRLLIAELTPPLRKCR